MAKKYGLDSFLDTLYSMKSTYEDQIKTLKQDKKNGLICEKLYKIQFNIWSNRVKQYEEMIKEEIDK